jgi:hypothetical protein
MISFGKAVMQAPSDSHMTRPQNCPVKVPWVLAVIATLSGWVLSWRDIQFI